MDFHVLLWIDEEDLTMWTAIYNLLLHIHIDKTDWNGALKFLDQAIRDTPHTTHKLWVN